MAKENTHIFFAEKLLGTWLPSKAVQLLSSYRSAYLFGNIMPDTFYYSRDTAVIHLSDVVHGTSGISLDNIIARLAATAMHNKSIADLAMLCGVLAHLALDAALHPFVDELSGNFDDPDPRLRRAARYRHRLVETAVDVKLGHTHFLHRSLTGDEFEGLHTTPLLAAMIQEPAEKLRHALMRQVRFNRLFTKTWAHCIARLLTRLGRKDLYSVLPLFYAHQRIDPVALPDYLEFTDPADGRVKQLRLEQLLLIAGQRSAELIEPAVSGYASGRMDLPVLDVLHRPL